MDEIVKLASELMRFRTTSDNPAGIRECADFIARCLRQNGVIVKVHERNDKLSIVATFEETKSPDIFFNAHFDVVPASLHLFVPRTDCDRLYGRGSDDCKAQVAILIMLMRRFALQEKKPSIGVMLTSDEEVGGRDGVNYLLSELGYSSKFALVADGGDNFDIVTKHKAFIQVRVSARGKSAHSSRPWEGGDNAIEKLIAAYATIKKLFPELKAPAWKTTASLNKISGGDIINKVPDYAELFLDIRRTENDSEDKIMQKLEKISGVQVEKLSSSDMLMTDENNVCIRKLRASAEKMLKRKIRIYHEHGATDARYFSAAGIPAVVFKPLGSGAHSDSEHAIISSLKPYLDVLVDFVNSSSKKII